MKAQVLTKETIMNYGVEKRNFPIFRVGDTIEVAQIIKEGEKERVQLFQGDVISMHGTGIASTFTLRKMGANNIGVERILPYHSKNISEIKVIKKGKVRRAKLRYLRFRTGRAARVKELVLTKEQKAHMQDRAA
jgi:large subunit ribosomal protein L19